MVVIFVNPFLSFMQFFFGSAQIHCCHTQPVCIVEMHYFRKMLTIVASYALAHQHLSVPALDRHEIPSIMFNDIAPEIEKEMIITFASECWT